MKRVVGAILLLCLLAGAAWGTWTYAIPHTARVPALRGDSVDDAVTRLTTLGFEVRLLEGEFHPTIPEGRVLRILPRPGTEREVGTTISVLPSRGPPPVRVPKVVGRPLPKARAAIADAGLEIRGVRHRFHDEVGAGTVIAVRPGKAVLPQGASVTLIVSDGPRPVPVPSVAGMAESKAVDSLATAGFEVVIEETFSGQVPKGRAIATDPGTGTELQPGQTVVLTVSLGPEYFPSPDFTGMNVEEAQAAAERAGLELTALPVPGSSGGNIVSQLPPPGTRVRYGSTITAYHA